jgi:hypothetical protein
MDLRQPVSPRLHLSHAQIINHDKQDHRTGRADQRDTPDKIKLSATVVLTGLRPSPTRHVVVGLVEGLRSDGVETVTEGPVRCMNHIAWLVGLNWPPVRSELNDDRNAIRR